MHSAPSQNEKKLYLDTGRNSIYIFGFFSTCCLLTGNIFFVYYNPYFWPYVLFVILTGFYLGMSYLVGFMGKPFDYENHIRICTKWLDRAEDASVDVYLPVCKEDISIIENTWLHVYQLKRAHRQIKVYALDDGKDDQVKRLADKYHFNYIRRETNELKKAGNLRNAFKQTDGEFILILDADFTCRTDMLIEMLPYMYEYPNAAIVQSPQYFTVNDHGTWVGRGASAVQELFYRLMQVSRDTFNSSICVGTNALYRRKALEPFGGTAPIPYSEDMRTSFMLISAGWRVFYIPINLAKGICPDDLKSFFVQQMRWSLGSISLFFSKEFWVSKITIMQRISYLTGIGYYISTGLSVLFAPLPSILMLTFYPEKIKWFNLLFTIPSFIFGFLFMAWWLLAPFGLYIHRSRQVSYFAHLFALRDFLFNNLEAWIPSGDRSTKSNRYESFKTWFRVLCIGPQLITFYLLVTRLIEGYDPRNFIILFLFMVLNAAITVPILWEFNDHP